MRGWLVSGIFLILAGSVPALAQDLVYPEDVQIKIPADILAAGREYDKAFAGLKPAQKAYLQKMDEGYLKTLQADEKIYNQAIGFQACHDIGQAEQALADNFQKFHDHEKQDQEFMAADFQNVVVLKVDFMDRKILEGHLYAVKFTQLGKAAKAARLNFANIDKASYKQKCDDLRGFLIDYVARNNL